MAACVRLVIRIGRVSACKPSGPRWRCRWVFCKALNWGEVDQHMGLELHDRRLARPGAVYWTATRQHREGRGRLDGRWYIVLIEVEVRAIGERLAGGVASRTSRAAIRLLRRCG